jgi:hypothetical protein
VFASIPAVASLSLSLISLQRVLKRHAAAIHEAHELLAPRWPSFRLEGVVSLLLSNGHAATLQALSVRAAVDPSSMVAGDAKPAVALSALTGRDVGLDVHAVFEFTNSHDTPVEARFMYATRGMMCYELVARLSDGRSVRAVCQEKAQGWQCSVRDCILVFISSVAAAASYDDAISSGGSAVLLSVDQSGLLTLSLGNLGSGTGCIVELRCLQECLPLPSSFATLTDVTPSRSSCAMK